MRATKGERVREEWSTAPALSWDCCAAAPCCPRSFAEEAHGFFRFVLLLLKDRSLFCQH